MRCCATTRWHPPRPTSSRRTSRGRSSSSRRLAVPAMFSLAIPEFHKEVSRMLADVPVAQWKSYLRFQHGRRRLALSQRGFRQRALRVLRQDAQRPAATGAALEARAGRAGERSRRSHGRAVREGGLSARMRRRAWRSWSATSRAALKVRIENLTWMSDATKEKALEKWAAFTPKIGYPVKWRDYAGLATVRDSYFGNVLAAQRLRLQVGHRQDRQAGGQDRVVHDAADRQRVLQPAGQRGGVPRCHPAAAVLRSEGRRCLQLRRHRRGDRPRAHAWLRRPGLALRAHRQRRGVVDAR